MHLAKSCVLLASLAATAAGQSATAWSSWRGPLGTGSAGSGDPPVRWSETENIRWKVPTPGHGISSPVIWQDRIYLTCAVATERQGTPAVTVEPQNQLAQPRPTVVHEFRVLAISRRDGQLLWNRKVAEAVPHEGGHRTNSHASHSPVTDGERIYVNFGSRGVYCLDRDGKLVWSKDLGTMRTRRQYGEASSPALHGDRLVINWDHEGDSFLAVFDKRTGEESWRQPRDEVTSWSTPLVVPVDGRPQIVINATTASRGYDLATGAVLWSLPGMTVNCIPHPMYADGVVYLMSGYRGDMVQAVALAGARGDLSDSPKVLWSHRRNAPYVPSGLLHGGCCYFLRKNNAVLSCVDARTGAVHYEGQRLRGLREVYASPVGVADRVYITSRDGVTRVIRHGPEFAELATNRVDDAVDASLALVGDEIYLRGHRHLYCIAKVAAAGQTPPGKTPPGQTPPGQTPPGKTPPGETPPGQAAAAAATGRAGAVGPVHIGSLGTAAERTASLSVGDVDGDGDLDLVVANGRHWPGQNRLFRNDGKGGFPGGENLDAERSNTYRVALADLDRDGDLDAVVGNDRAPSRVLWNDGRGRFKPGPQVGRIANTRSVILADLDGAAGVDVIFTNRRQANLICFNDGQGGFGRTATFGAAEDATIQVAAGDVDGDGDLDLAVANRDGQQNRVYLNDGKGGFTRSVPYGTGADNTRGVALADVDGDGHLDILNANIGEPNAVYFGDGKAGFRRTRRFGGTAASFAVATADLDRDGRLDVIIGNARSENAVYLQQADGSFARVGFGPADGVTYGVVAADWDGDGRPEIATANSDGRNHLYRWGTRER